MIDDAAPIELDVYEVREGSGLFGPMLQKHAEKAGIEVVVKPLSVGDISIVSANMELVLIERKSTDSDLFTSLTSGRLVDQCRRLADEADIPILLIEGPIYIMRGGFVRGTQFKTRLKYSSLLNQLMTIQIELGVTIIQVQTKPYASRWVLQCYRYFQKEQHTSVIESRLKPFSTSVHGLTPEEKKLRILMAVPGLGAELAGRLIGIYGSVRGVADASVKGLTAVPGLGPITAQAIKDVLN